jgi:hypothetical protein
MSTENTEKFGRPGSGTWVACHATLEDPPLPTKSCVLQGIFLVVSLMAHLPKTYLLPTRTKGLDGLGLSLDCL